MKNKKVIFAVLLFFFLSHSEKAFAIGVTNAFGGPITMVYECTCSGGLYVLLYDYTTMLPLPLLYIAGTSRLNSNFNIFTPTVQILGSYYPVGVCSSGSEECGTIPVLGTITSYPFAGVGTGGI